MTISTRNIIPITGRASSVIEKVFIVRTLSFKNKIERRKKRRLNNTR